MLKLKVTHISQFFDLWSSLADNAAGLALMDQHAKVELVVIYAGAILFNKYKK